MRLALSLASTVAHNFVAGIPGRSCRLAFARTIVVVGLVLAAQVLLPAAVRAEGGSFKVYVVQSGDSLSQIAAESGTTVEALAELNSLSDPDRVLPGIALVIGTPSGRLDGAAGSSAAAHAYRVEPGDTLSGIAERFGVEPQTLALINNLTDRDAIQVDAALVVPSHPAPPAPEVEPRHVVQPGETATAIAEWYRIPVATLARANGLTDPDLLRSGTLLVIPARPLPVPPPTIVGAVARAASYYELDPYLVLGLSYMESGWQMDVVSPTGAVGMMQVMPETAEWVMSDLGLPVANWRNVLIDNTYVGTAYLAHLLSLANGDVATALAAYYQGWEALQADGDFDDTRDYVEDVLALVDRFKAVAPIFNPPR